jgi:hypothetical protein
MRGLSKLLLTIGIIAIPLWYIYRTLEEKRVRRLVWSEVFMTEPERQRKRAEDERKTKEDAEAKRVEGETNLAKAKVQAERETKARKDAEAEADTARARAIQAQNVREEQLGRVKLADEQIKADAAASRAKVEAERVAKQHAVAAVISICADKASRAEAARVRLQPEQRTFQSFYEEASKTPLPEDEPMPLPQQQDISAWLAWSKRVHRSDFAAAFRMLSAREALKVFDSDSLKAAKENCDAAAVNSGDENSYQVLSALDRIDRLEFQYSDARETLKRSRSDLVDLIDYVGGKLGNSVGDEVRRARVGQTLARARDWREKP